MTIADLETLPRPLTWTFLRNEPYLARVQVAAITDGETLYVPPHWHEMHDELFRVIKGRLAVMIGKEWRDYVPEDGEIRIPKGVVHSLRGFKGEETIFEERTEPMDPEKEIFFRNLLTDGKVPTSFFYVMTVAYHGDMRPALPGHIKWLERGLVTLVGYYIAPLFGYRVKYEGYKKSI
ncbi:hypothetical protein CPB84DRAFT_1775781 [Gymnopilus junonius]|uniref:Cupin type-2 domain-containing protein n=1 Tax=Gymnopilus junonius TaxID=109634 RepID=A0A9P5TPF6_GYMJU|nr:hypothetical protein CPB84DRAFT_1775781 [Gymnopilus junonius]